MGDLHKRHMMVRASVNVNVLTVSRATFGVFRFLDPLLVVSSSVEERNDSSDTCVASGTMSDGQALVLPAGGATSPSSLRPRETAKELLPSLRT